MRQTVKVGDGGTAKKGNEVAEKVVIGNAELWHGDCREVLPLLPKHGLVLTDPPYGIGAARGSHSNLKMADEAWDDETPPAWLFGLMQEKGEHLIVWGGNYFPLPPSQGFVIWDKIQPEDFSLAMCEFAWLNTATKRFCFSNRFSRGVPMVDTRHCKKSLTVPATQHSPRVVLGYHECLALSNNTTRMVRRRPANPFGWKSTSEQTTE